MIPDSHEDDRPEIMLGSVLIALAFVGTVALIVIIYRYLTNGCG